MSRTGSSYNAVPVPNDTQLGRGYGSNPTSTTDFAQGNPSQSSPLSQSMGNPHNPVAYSEGLSSPQRGSSVAEDGDMGVDRTTSIEGTTMVASPPSRSNTLKKKGSVRRTNSTLKRSNSKRSLKAGSLAGYGGMDSNHEFNSFSDTPIPTQGSPTEVLANRFQAWRQLLKSLIAYFREIQASYEMRAKATHKLQTAISNIAHPAVFKSSHGLGEATEILDEYHKRSIAEANKSREIEDDVIGALTGLRSDLGQKIKEIKSLSGDFKNSVEKEKDATRREVEKLQDALQHVDHDDGSAMGKGDPFVVRLGVDRAIEKQIDEENYLHRAYLNLESSGRELESIVVGEIQKAYNALAGILKREGDDAYHAVETLRGGPIAMPKDVEWKSFVSHDPHFVDPNIPLRRIEDIEYPGKHHPAAAEVRAGMLERKSKYLKSYTPGWYVLSPTHLHEFKSADKIYTQPPVMSLYLPDQKLGSHSQSGSSSHKFMLKGKQSGNMHKGHNWVFRAETYDTMLAWFEDMRVLTEKSGEERIAYVRKHARSFSGTSRRNSVSSDGLEEDDADKVPYSADAASLQNSSQPQDVKPARPQPGGRFPSQDMLHTPRNRNVSVGQSSESSDGRNTIATAGAIPTSLDYGRNGEDPYRLDGVSAGTRPGTSYTQYTAGNESYFGMPSPEGHNSDVTDRPFQRDMAEEPKERLDSAEHSSLYGDWMAPAATGAVGAGMGVAAVDAYRHPDENLEPQERLVETYQPSGLSTTRVVPLYDHRAVVTLEDQPTEQPALASNATPDMRSTIAPPEMMPGDSEVGGLQGGEAGETGVAAPVRSRQDTSMSISQLHVPGEYPKQL